MMGIDAKQLRLLVVRPVLRNLEAWSLAAERLVLATAIVESRLTYLEQLPAGPALGLFQMEPATHDDIWQNFLIYKPALANRVRDYSPEYRPAAQELIWNLAYAAAMARVHYLRRRPPLPEAEDLAGLADYWKAHYNTPRGAGTPERFREEVMPFWQTPAFRDQPWPGT